MDRAWCVDALAIGKEFGVFVVSGGNHGFEEVWAVGDGWLTKKAAQAPCGCWAAKFDGFGSHEGLPAPVLTVSGSKGPLFEGSQPRCLPAPLLLGLRLVEGWGASMGMSFGESVCWLAVGGVYFGFPKFGYYESHRPLYREAIVVLDGVCGGDVDGGFGSWKHPAEVDGAAGAERDTAGDDLEVDWLFATLLFGIHVALGIFDIDPAGVW